MNPFVSWGIAVAIVMAVVLGLFWLKGGPEQAKLVAIAMYIKATLVYKS